MINNKHKKAFSMLTAIVVILVMASVTALVQNVSGKTLKSTTQQYQREQAELLARSYTELALLYIMHYDRVATNSCIQIIRDHFGNSSPEGYDVIVKVKYIGNSLMLPNCPNNITSSWSVPLPSTSFNQSISLSIDTFITYKDMSDKNVTFYRRSIQKL